jgi:lipid II:glycine glycyltransferase (peptidoglycan interpeptide bridge formation enzyme)
MHQPYFVQTQKWATFWQLANPVNHSYFWVEVQKDNFNLKFLVCNYPWHLGQKFWYISKGGTLTNLENNKINDWESVSKIELEGLFLDLVNKVNRLAKEQGITYVKYDFEEELIQKLELKNNQQVLEFLNSNCNYKSKISDKIVQYLSTMTLDLRSIQGVSQIQNYDQESLTNLWNDTQDFWKTTNNNVKRYTKKSLDKNWHISTEKSTTNFEKFYKIYNHTKDIRGFAIQSRDYLEKLYSQDFSKIIILSDESGEPHCVWFGIQIGNTQTYLYGGNTQKSFDDYGQYLVHLVALNSALANQAKFYDLGGYDANSGYGKFKDNYKGAIRIFPGAIDTPINQFKFYGISLIINSIKKIKSIFKR